MVVPAFAAVQGTAGPYHVAISTQPRVVPVGQAQVLIDVTDAAGKPVTGAQVHALVQMPSMPMGEHEASASPQHGKPGVYSAPATFAMAGGYNATITISGPLGEGHGVIPLNTGEDTGGAGGGFSPISLLPWLVVIVAAAFVVYRMRKTGQHVDAKRIANRGAITAVVLLAAIVGFSIYAIGHWRRAGAMTPIEAQAMQMNTPPPPGSVPVTLATVTRGMVRGTVRYTGQVVGFNEEDVYARTSGWLTWMPLYVGDRVHMGQLVARLDTSEIDPQVAERAAAVAMASQGVDVARAEYQQSRADVSSARGEEASRRAALQAAKAQETAAREERSAANDALSAAESNVVDAQAQVRSAVSDQQYWQQEIARERMLFSKKAVSKEEYQRESAEADAADAKVQQARAAVAAAEANVRASRAGIGKADAMVAAAQSSVATAGADVQTRAAQIGSAQAGEVAVRRKIAAAQAGVQQARGSLESATTSRSYADIHALISGMVTQRALAPGVFVSAGQPILRIAQLSPIRLQANVAEADLDHVRIGARVVVHGADGTRPPVIAHVTSISPSVDPVARTGVVEAIVANPGARFLPGQYVSMDITTAQDDNPLRVPSAAVHSHTPAEGIIATHAEHFVWVADPSGASDGQFTAHAVDVRIGPSDGTYTAILSGLSQGQQVVVQGAEDLANGDTLTAAAATPSPAAPAPMVGMPGMGHASAASKPAAAIAGSTATVEVSSAGFTPGVITLKAGVPARLTFIRKDTQNCATQIVLPEYHVSRDLPLNQPVVIEFTPRKGEIEFRCGMNMLHGKVVGQ